MVPSNTICMCLYVYCREDSCLCNVSSMLVTEFEDDLTAISSCSDENDLSKLSHYLTAGRGKVILQLLSTIGITVCSLSVCPCLGQSVI